MPPRDPDVFETIEEKSGITSSFVKSLLMASFIAKLQEVAFARGSVGIRRGLDAENLGGVVLVDATRWCYWLLSALKAHTRTYVSPATYESLTNQIVEVSPCPSLRNTVYRPSFSEAPIPPAKWMSGMVVAT